MDLTGTKAQVELEVRVGIIFVALLISASLDVFSQIAEVYLPRQQLQDFRSDYLEEKRKQWRELLSEDIRVNVMFARRPWHFPFARRLQWTWSTGYKPPHRHHDANLKFWEWQGVCGFALGRNVPVFADLRRAPQGQSPYWKNDFLLGPRQFKKTQAVKAVLSVPLYVKVGRESPTWKAVGVVSLDTLDDAGADLLANNRERLQEYFVQIGMSIARLWV